MKNIFAALALAGVSLFACGAHAQSNFETTLLGEVEQTALWKRLSLVCEYGAPTIEAFDKYDAALSKSAKQAGKPSVEDLASARERGWKSLPAEAKQACEANDVRIKALAELRASMAERIEASLAK